MANTKNVFINWVSRNLIHEAHKEDKTFYNISIPYAESKNGYANLSVSAGQVLAATKRDGTVNNSFASILLGAPDKVRQLSICSKITKTGKKTYAKIEMTNAEIAEAYEASRKAYKESQTAETQAAETAAAPAPAIAG